MAPKLVPGNIRTFLTGAAIENVISFTSQSGITAVPSISTNHSGRASA